MGSGALAQVGRRSKNKCWFSACRASFARDASDSCALDSDVHIRLGSLLSLTGRLPVWGVCIGCHHVSDPALLTYRLHTAHMPLSGSHIARALFARRSGASRVPLDRRSGAARNTPERGRSKRSRTPLLWLRRRRYRDTHVRSQRPSRCPQRVTDHVSSACYPCSGELTSGERGRGCAFGTPIGRPEPTQARRLASEIAAASGKHRNPLAAPFWWPPSGSSLAFPLAPCRLWQ